MEYRIAQKRFTFRDSFDIIDLRSGEVPFTCKGERTTFTKKFTLIDAGGTPIITVRRRLCRIPRRIDICLSGVGNPIAICRVKPGLFRKKIKVSGTQGDYLVYGDMNDWDFTVYEGTSTSDGIVATVSKRIGKAKDTYDISIIEGNEAFLMSVCLAVCYLYCKRG